MNSLLKNRLTIVRGEPRKVVVPQPTPAPPPPAIPPSEIRKIVLDYLAQPEPSQTKMTPEPQQDELIFTFKGIEHFVDWYIQHLDDFNDAERIAFGSLVQARQGINAGCSCKRQARLRMAEDYYVHFFTQVVSKELNDALKKVTGANTLNFFRDGNLILKV